MTPKDLPELTDVQAFQNTDREVWRETPGDFYSNSVHLTATGGLGINVGGTVYVKPPAEWHRLASGARSTAHAGSPLGPDADWALAIKEALGGSVDAVPIVPTVEALSNLFDSVRSTAAQPLTLSHEEIDRVFNEHEEAPQISYRYWVANALLAAANEKSPTAAAKPVEPTGPWLDDEGRAMIANSHHYTAANIKAIVDELNCLSDPDRTPLSDIENKDLRTWFGVLARIITGLAHEVPAPPAASGDSTPPSAIDEKLELIGLEHLKGRPDAELLNAIIAWHVQAEKDFGDPSGALRPEPEAVGQDCHGLDTPERVRFYEHDFYVLSNFSAFALYWRGVRFDTSEAAYHFEKFPYDGNIRAAIANAPSAHEAFKIAERHKIARRADWDDVKVDIMRDILRAKAQQHEYVRRKLLATGDRELVEDSWRDDFWGWGPNRDGKNVLGRLWMEVRAEFRAAEPPQAASGSRRD